MTEKVDGLIGFLLSAIAVLLTQSPEQQYIVISSDVLKLHDGTQTKKKLIPRVESELTEFSIGLNSSDLIDEELTQLGELCTAGRMFLLGAQVGLATIAAFYVGLKLKLIK